MWRFFPPVAKKPRPTPEEGGEGGESSNVPAPVDVELEVAVFFSLDEDVEHRNLTVFLSFHRCIVTLIAFAVLMT